MPQHASCQHQAAQAQIPAQSPAMPALALPPAPPEQKPATSLAARFASGVEQRQQDRMAATVAKVLLSQQSQAQQPQQQGAAWTDGWQSLVLVMHCDMVRPVVAIDLDFLWAQSIRSCSIIGMALSALKSCAACRSDEPSPQLWAAVCQFQALHTPADQDINR